MFSYYKYWTYDPFIVCFSRLARNITYDIFDTNFSLELLLPISLNLVTIILF